MTQWHGGGWGAALLAGVPVLALGFAQGGYFAPTWGWGALGFLWVAAIALVLRRSVTLGALDGLFVGGLAALAAWMLVSSTWSSAPTEAVLDGERALLYVTGAAALALVTDRSNAGWLLGGLLAAIAVLCGYGLATRLLFTPAGAADSLGQYRLAEPLGYWNALGLLAGLGALLALGGAAARSRVARAISAALVVVLVTTLDFTFGRAAWLALIAAYAVTIALATGRRRALLAALALAAPWIAAALALAVSSPALTSAGSPESAIHDQGLRFAVALVVLSTLAAVAAQAQPRVEAVLPSRVPAALVRAGLAAFALAAVGLLIATGGPARILVRVQSSFTTPPTPIEGTLDQRLFRLYGEGRAAVWRVAWETASAHPAIGSGAGSFQQRWLQARPRPQGFRNAHNLYLETLAELGVIGLALLAVALGAPLAAARRARDHPLVPPAAGALVAYLLHAGVDWDWEMPAVTLAALVCASACVAIGGRERVVVVRWPARAGGIVVAAALAGLAIVGLIGNGAIGASIAALRDGDALTAEREAQRAAHWAPWSAEPFRYAGEARMARGDLDGARASFLAGTRREPRDWAQWYGLALVSGGAARARALARAAALNPLSPEVRELTKR